MASAGCNFTMLAGPFRDEIPGKRVYYGRMSFTGGQYDRTDLPRVHGGATGSRPQDVFHGTVFIDQLILYQAGAELNNNEANQAGQGTADAKGEFLIDTQRVRMWTMGTKSDGTGPPAVVAGLDETELKSNPNPLTSMTFECKVVCGA